MNLSIIVINYNTKDITLDCLKSVEKNTKGVTYEILLIDNASTDGSVEFFRKYCKSAKNTVFIENKTNLGFGRANNQGIRRAKGEFVLLLNSDTVVNDNCIYEIYDWMKKHPEAGAATCALKNKDGSMQGTGGSFPTLFKVFSWMFFLEDLPFVDKLIKPFHPVHGQSPFYKGEEEVLVKRKQDWITGAFMMIPASVLKKVGMFDDDYFMYTEEVELCYRMAKAGYQIWYLPKWSITHLGGASSTREFPILSEYKGVKLFYKKHFPPWQYGVLRLFLKAGAFLRIFLFFVLKGREASKTYVKAFQLA